MKKRIRVILMAILCSIELTGCSKTTVDNDVTIYYAGDGNAAFYTEDYNWKSMEPERQVAYVLRKMKLPQDLSRGRTTLIEGVEIEEYEIQDRVVRLDVTEAYNSMKKTSRILLQAALLRSLTQIKGVDEIAIGVNGKFEMNEKGELLTIKKEDFLMEGEDAFFRAKRHEQIRESDVEEVEAVK